MEYKIRRAVPADEQRIRELFIEMLNAIYHTQDVELRLRAILRIGGYFTTRY